MWSRSSEPSGFCDASHVANCTSSSIHRSAPELVGGVRSFPKSGFLFPLTLNHLRLRSPFALGEGGVLVDFRGTDEHCYL